MIGVHRNQYFKFRPEPELAGTSKKIRPEPELENYLVQENISFSYIIIFLDSDSQIQANKCKLFLYLFQ